MHPLSVTIDGVSLDALRSVILPFWLWSHILLCFIFAFYFILRFCIFHCTPCDAVRNATKTRFSSKSSSSSTDSDRFCGERTRLEILAILHIFHPSPMSTCVRHHRVVFEMFDRMERLKKNPRLISTICYLFFDDRSVERSLGKCLLSLKSLICFSDRFVSFIKILLVARTKPTNKLQSYNTAECASLCSSLSIKALDET